MVDPHAKWKAARGDQTYALDWLIDEDARVWEIGGFEGRWAAQMIHRYNPHMEVFEPQVWAYNKLQTIFQEREKVKVYPFGLWVMNAALPLYNMGSDGASLLKHDTHAEVCQFRDAYELAFQQVDVCLLNIEGGEYALLPYLIGCDLMKNFRYFWCQFHPGLVSEGEARYTRICNGMKRTHRRLWEFYPSAVAWERIK